MQLHFLENGLEILAKRHIISGVEAGHVFGQQTHWDVRLWIAVPADEAARVLRGRRRGLVHRIDIHGQNGRRASVGRQATVVQGGGGGRPGAAAVSRAEFGGRAAECEEFVARFLSAGKDTL